MKSLSWKKVLIFIACITAIAALCTVTAFAEDYGNFRYSTSEDGSYIIITGYNADGDTPEPIELPNDIDDVPVTHIADNAFKNNDLIGDVIFCDNLTTIGTGAFANCDGLTTVILGNGVKEIGTSAFFECPNLVNFYMSDSVETIGDIAFKDCPLLANIRFGAGLKDIGKGAFFNCDSLKGAILPDSIQTVGKYAFALEQNGNDTKATDGFTFFTANEAVKAYAKENKLTVKAVPECVNEGEWTLFRHATDTYTGYEISVCPDCGALSIRENTEVEKEKNTSMITSFAVILVLCAAFGVVCFIYVKKEKSRRAKAIEEYKKNNPEKE